MIKPNSVITLRAYKTYKDEPEKNVPFLESNCEMGRLLYFQALDHNRDPITKAMATGFYNVCILTNQELAVGDKVTVKSILGAKMFRMKRMLLITIMEQGEKRPTSKAIEGFELGDCDF